MKINKIVLTGGPCSGKTTALGKIQGYFSKIGYKVLFVPEAATELINSGLGPEAYKNLNLDFQITIGKLQMAKEKIFTEAAEKSVFDKVLIVCDRGIIDNKAYMTKDEFQGILDAFGTTEVQLRDTYDAVIHLVTAAKGAVENYTTANNTARRESPEEAAAIDDKLLAAWTGHPHLRVIDNSTDFDTKIDRVIKEILAFLGEPEPYEIERKFLIEYPDISWLETLPNCRKVEIIQTYLKAAPGEEFRVRQRGENGSYTYYKTLKKTISAVKRLEFEERLSENEYLTLLMEADTSKRQIRKNRYCLTYEHQYFEIDIYPFWEDKAIMEIELRHESDPIKFPEGIKIIKEVTDDDAYDNASLATI